MLAAESTFLSEAKGSPVSSLSLVLRWRSTYSVTLYTELGPHTVHWTRSTHCTLNSVHTLYTELVHLCSDSFLFSCSAHCEYISCALYSTIKKMNSVGDDLGLIKYSRPMCTAPAKNYCAAASSMSKMTRRSWRSRQGGWPTLALTTRWQGVLRLLRRHVSWCGRMFRKAVKHGCPGLMLQPFVKVPHRPQISDLVSWGRISVHK